MDTTMITDDTLKEVILSVVNADGEKYWVKSISRAHRSNLTGTEIELAEIKKSRGVSKNPHILIHKFNMVTDEALQPFARALNEAFVAKLCEVSPEYKKFYDDAMLKIDEKTEAFRLRLVDAFYEKGYVRNDIKPYYKGSGLDDLRARIEQNRHSEYISIENNLYSRDRILNPGDVFYANLNPVLQYECGGIRPVVIINSGKHRSMIVPISSTQAVDDKQYKLVSAINDDAENNYVCIESLQTVNNRRILESIGHITDEELNGILDMISEQMFGVKRDKLAGEENDFMIFDEEDEQDDQEQEEVSQATYEVPTPQITDNPQTEKPAKVKIEPLTEEELFEVAQQRLDYLMTRVPKIKCENLRVVANNPFDCLFTFDATLDGRRVIQPNRINLFKYNAEFQCGSMYFSNDKIGRRMLFDKYYEKYGEDYKTAYLYFCVNNCNERYNKPYGVLAECVQRLNFLLQTARKQAKNPEELVKSGYLNIGEDLVDILPVSYEEEDVDMNAVIEEMTKEDILESKRQQPVPKAVSRKDLEQRQQSCKIDFELTDDEIMDVAWQQVAYAEQMGSKIVYDNPMVSGTGLLRDKIIVLFNQQERPEENKFRISYIFEPFKAYINKNNRQYMDMHLTKFLVEKLAKKYPDYYPMAYARHCVTSANGLFQRYPEKFEVAKAQLVEQLSFIGKIAPEEDELVREGLDAYWYGMLLDKPQDEQN